MTLVRKIHSMLRRSPRQVEARNEQSSSEHGSTVNTSIRPTRSFEAFFEHLQSLGVRPDICIDVGAATGTPSIYQAFPAAKHIAFEPLPDFQSALREALAPYDAIAKNCALSDHAGERTLLRHNDLFGSSIMHSREDNDDRVVTVKTSTLDIEMSDVDLANNTVLLKTDCQGSDLMVLKGGAETLKHCDIVLVEASLFRFWGPHQPDFYDIVEFMHASGFALYDLLDGLYRPLDSALGQLDLAFVKHRGPLREKHYW